MMFRTFVATWPGRLVALLIIAAIGGGAAMVARANTPAPAVAPRTATVTRGSITQTVNVSGSVNASTQTRLNFKAGGRLAQTYVTVGQAVTPGQPLAKLDTTDLEIALANAQSNLSSAQVSYQKQLLAAADTQRALSEAQRQTANDIASAQQSLTKLQNGYSSAKTNIVSLTSSIASDVATYRANLDTLRKQTEDLIGLFDSDSTGADFRARASLSSADTSLQNAQSYGSDVLAPAVNDLASSRDTLLGVVSAFDNALAAGSDTSAASSAYQLVVVNFNLSTGRLSSALDTVNTQVSAAQTSIAAAQTMIVNTTSTGDRARIGVIALSSAVTNETQIATTMKGRVSQTASATGTIGDVVAGGLVAAQQAIQATQDRAAATIRSAQSAVATAPLNVQSAQVNVDTAANAVATATSNLDAAVLTAPSAGTVSAIANQVGETVGSSATGFLVLTNTSAVALHGTIGEGDIAKLKMAMVANVTVDALSGSRMTGRVTSIDPVATISQGVPVYGVDVTIDVPAAGLRPGMSGTASVIIASKQGVLTVPNTAIRTFSGQRGVQLLKGGEIVETPAQFGIANDTLTEVLNGLQEGDTVVIPQARPAASGQGGGTRIGVPGPGGGFGR